MGGLFIIALLALVAGVGIVALIETEPGYLLIAYGGYTVETSFWVGILLIATAVLLMYASLRFLHRLITSPANVLNWAGERRLRQSARLTSRGIVNFIEGNWAKSRKQLLRGARYSESPLLNYLMAARASYRLQEPEATRRQLEQAAESDLEAVIAVDLTQAELQLNDRQYEKALRTLDTAKKNPGKHPQVLHLLCKAYDGLGDIEAMLALLPALRKYRIGGALELDDLEARIHHDLLEQAAVTGDAALLKARWKKYPARLVDDEAVQLHYLSSLLACDEVAAVEKDIERRVKKNWNPALINLYGRIKRDTAQKQLATAESWLRQHADDPELLLCLGRLAMVERQWAKARDYLERSHAARSSEEVCLELGRLLTAVGDHATAAEMFRLGTGLRAQPLPELPQPDDVVADSLPETHRIEN
ncbi:heme biosynthesis HemY N-terminal domain-containing protein [Congregibacter brevis]|uniref:Heme biosynthesis HemY N-terminal domain-containing protein n=1 Tax=Congregibacter brevis TaxID=3081201 RepID=A0ABZ0IEC2_9GAMM|nr:heme biosynthesis HemY N-terminal domain-containing protein [Congregibacter sp. IMCC45268]